MLEEVFAYCTTVVMLCMYLVHFVIRRRGGVRRTFSVDTMGSNYQFITE